MNKPAFVLDAAEERAFRQLHALLRRRFCYDCTLLRLRNASLYEVVQSHDKAVMALSNVFAYIEKGYWK